MPVPGGSENYLKNTTGGAFSSQTQGGTLLGNNKASVPASPLANLFPLLDNASAWSDLPLPKVKNNGLSANQKAYTAGDFAYSAAGEYVIMASSTTLSGQASTKMLITGADSLLGRHAIHQFQHDFGADTTSLMRANRFSRVGYFNNGTKVNSRSLWLNAAGTAVAAPSTLTANLPWDPVAGAAAANSDSAANPTRAIPGELVMKVDFVTLAPASGGDFFDYKAITGM